MRNPKVQAAYRAAHQLGVFWVDQMLDSAPAGQLENWEAFADEGLYSPTVKEMSVLGCMILNELIKIKTHLKDGTEPKPKDLYKHDDFYLHRSSTNKPRGRRAPPLRMMSGKQVMVGMMAAAKRGH